MKRETRIALLVGLTFIALFGLVLGRRSMDVAAASRGEGMARMSDALLRPGPEIPAAAVNDRDDRPVLRPPSRPERPPATPQTAPPRGPRPRAVPRRHRPPLPPRTHRPSAKRPPSCTTPGAPAAQAQNLHRPGRRQPQQDRPEGLWPGAGAGVPVDLPGQPRQAAERLDRLPRPAACHSAAGAAAAGVPPGGGAPARPAPLHRDDAGGDERSVPPRAAIRRPLRRFPHRHCPPGAGQHQPPRRPKALRSEPRPDHRSQPPAGRDAAANPRLMDPTIRK